MSSGVTAVAVPAGLQVGDVLPLVAGASLVVLLDSAARIRPRDARYSFLTADPVATERLDRVRYGQAVFEGLRAWQRLLPTVADAELPPFCGGIAGLMSYELGEAFERLPRPPRDEFQTPALLAGLFDWCLAWDHVSGQCQGYVLQLQGPVAGEAAEPRFRRRLGWLQELLRQCDAARAESRAGESARCSGSRPSLTTPHTGVVPHADQRASGSADAPQARPAAVALPHSPTADPTAGQLAGDSVTGANAAGQGTAGPLSRLTGTADREAGDGTGLAPLEQVAGVYSDFTRDQYLAAVQRVVDYIRAGDIFQANLSQRLTAEWHGSAEALYRQVRRLNPAPFCGLLQAADFAVISASPERFLKVRQGRFVETRPIKGTRRRQKSPIADLFTGDELASSEKDRAENVMIVDLLRNDLSRSCRPGTVRVTGLCEIEVFETVQHLVSTVVGELAEGRDIWDLLAGCFPGGSITGAPKIRAMQIIAELEPVVRGAYCGSLFFAGPQGDFDSSILIRTFTLKDGRLQFPVGGGIVADSLAEDEYRETLHKASGMLRVLQPAAVLPAASERRV